MRAERRVLGFDLLREQQVDWVVPTMDGTRLIDIVREYERSMGYEPAGSYAGLIPSFFNSGPLTSTTKVEALTRRRPLFSAASVASRDVGHRWYR